MEKQSKIYVAGHSGMVGSAIVRQLQRQGYENLVLRTHKELDLCSQAETETFFAEEKPDYVFAAAGLVGGIQANSEAPADYFLENMFIANHLIASAYRHGVKKLLYLGSACMYPKDCSQPMTEELLLTGLPESTNEGYALAKICGSRLCGYMNRQYGTNFISAVPANAYGIKDCTDPGKSHVIPALFLKFRQAKQNGESYVKLWGTGAALREFLYADDLADAAIFLMNHYSGSEAINIGSGREISVLKLAKLIQQIVGYKGTIIWDLSKSDGMKRRLLDNRKIAALGWEPGVSLEDGLRQVDEWLLANEF